RIAEFSKPQNNSDYAPCFYLYPLTPIRIASQSKKQGSVRFSYGRILHSAVREPARTYTIAALHDCHGTACRFLYPEESFMRKIWLLLVTFFLITSAFAATLVV